VGDTPGSYEITYTATGGSYTTTVTRTVNVVEITNPDPSLTLSAAGSVPTGTQLTYTIEVANAGSAAALGVIVTNPLPAGTSFVSASGPYSVSKGKNPTVTWNLGTLSPTLPGQPLQLTLVVKVSAKAGTVLTNKASVSSSPQDLDVNNNTAVVSTTVDPRK
jgi:large repetitive protein